jgi:hypothetical protein
MRYFFRPDLSKSCPSQKEEKLRQEMLLNGKQIVETCSSDRNLICRRSGRRTRSFRFCFSSKPWSSSSSLIMLSAYKRSSSSSSFSAPLTDIFLLVTQYYFNNILHPPLATSFSSRLSSKSNFSLFSLLFAREERDTETRSEITCTSSSRSIGEHHK